MFFSMKLTLCVCFGSFHHGRHNEYLVEGQFKKKNLKIDSLFE